MFYTKYTIREMNENIVLKEIINSSPISRASLAKKTKLNKATITEIVNTLISRDLVNEIGYGKSKDVGGRKPILLELNKDAGVALAIDVGNDYVDAITTNLIGEIISTYNIKNIEVSDKNLTTIISEVVDKFNPTKKDKPYGFIGLTVAIHGIIFENKITFSPNYNLQGMDLYERLNEKFDFPVYIENEANLAAIGHITYKPNLFDLVVISIHTGIGAGVIINRELYTGINGAAGELGHMIIHPNGLQCRCGRKGCFEQYCSTHHVVKRYRKIINSKDATVNDLARDFISNDKVRLLIEETCYDLAVGINNLVASYDPEAVYIIDELITALPEMLEITKKYLKDEFFRDVEIIVSEPSFNAILRGASSMSITNFFNFSSLKLK